MGFWQLRVRIAKAEAYGQKIPYGAEIASQRETGLRSKAEVVVNDAS